MIALKKGPPPAGRRRRPARASRTYWLGLAVAVPAVAIGVHAYFLRGRAATEDGDHHTATVLTVTAIVCGAILVGVAAVVIAVLVFSRRTKRAELERLVAESPDSLVVMVGWAKKADTTTPAMRGANAVVVDATHLHVVRARRDTQVLRSIPLGQVELRQGTRRLGSTVVPVLEIGTQGGGARLSVIIENPRRLASPPSDSLEDLIEGMRAFVDRRGASSGARGEG